MSALYIGELKSILSQFDESWNEGFSRKHWSIVNGAYDCAYELHYYDDKYNDQFLLTCIMDSFDTPKSAKYEIGFNKAFNDSQINQILDTLNEYLGHNFTCSLRENNESSTVQPQTTEELAEIIRQTCEEQGWDCDLNFIDTSKITDMSYLFSDNEEYGYGLEHFNGDISKWNTSNVTDMHGMFENAKTFNQPLNSWDVSNVENMEDMFFRASTFNQPLNNWDVSNVTDMNGMFEGAKSFNQPLNNWNVSNVQDMSFMFRGAKTFNQPIDNWDVSNVEKMGCMFYCAESFNQPLNNWDVSNVTDMFGMFDGVKNFNQPLDNWDVSKVENMIDMFRNAHTFNQPLDNWDLSNKPVGAKDLEKFRQSKAQVVEQTESKKKAFHR